MTSATILPTANQAWGFFGSIRHHADSDQAWALAFPAIAAATGASGEGVRAFLDSRQGRHFADEVADELHAGLPLPEAVEAAVERWMGWRIGRRTSGEEGQDREQGRCEGQGRDRRVKSGSKCPPAPAPHRHQAGDADRSAEAGGGRHHPRGGRGHGMAAPHSQGCQRRSSQEEARAGDQLGEGRGPRTRLPHPRLRHHGQTRPAPQRNAPSGSTRRWKVAPGRIYTMRFASEPGGMRPRERPGQSPSPRSHSSFSHLSRKGSSNA